MVCKLQSAGQPFPLLHWLLFYFAINMELAVGNDTTLTLNPQVADDRSSSALEKQC